MVINVVQLEWCDDIEASCRSVLSLSVYLILFVLNDLTDRVGLRITSSHSMLVWLFMLADMQPILLLCKL